MFTTDNKERDDKKGEVVREIPLKKNK